MTSEQEFTRDGLFRGELQFLQPRQGYRFSVDAPLLASFVKLKRGDRVIDLGTGCGVILVILARRFPKVRELVGVEVQEGLAELARRNAELNGVGNLIRIVRGDIRECRKNFAPETFDVVVSNPPYYPSEGGRVNPGDEVAIARHEVMATMADFAEATRYLLKGGGRCYFVYPARRAVNILTEMRQRRLEPKRLRWVHPRPGEEARMVLVEGVKGAGEGVAVEPPLFIHDSQGNYTPEMERVLFRLEVEDG